MPIYKDCTLGEVITIAGISIALLIIIFSLLSKLLCGYLWPGYLLASILFLFLTKGLLTQLQKLKYGKPHGYYKQLILKKCCEAGLIQINYITRIGRWGVKRKL